MSQNKTMGFKVEYWLDDNCLLVGDIEEADESFDHAFGVQKQSGLEIKNFSIVVFFDGGFEYDITPVIRDRYPKEYERFKEKFLSQCAVGHSV